MATEFLPVPNWFSWENQGASLALADLDGSGQSDLIVFQIDAPEGANQGFYRIGRNLDATGKVTGGWSDWIAVPDWFSWENQGAGIAIADLDGNGQPELIVFQIDSPPGANQGYYRIGWNLDATGKVTGGWSDWIAVPDWFSWENQGADIAIADLDGNGQSDLIVFQVDAPEGANQGYYRIGWNLDATGQVTDGWSDWIPLDWFSWENQDAGIAIADLDGNGRPELLIFQLDNPPGANQGFYQIGWNLDTNGKVTGGWSPWVAVEWFSWENQGAGVAIADLDSNGRSELLLIQIDNPPNTNQAYYQVLDLEIDLDQAATKGIWRLLQENSQVLAMHAALFHTGKVGFFSGSSNNPDNLGTPFRSVVWDYENNTFLHPQTPADFFCAGHAFLPDGRLLVAGGTKEYDSPQHGFFGLKDAFVFDSTDGKWKGVPDMAGGRWYPTLLTLGDGRVLAVSGQGEDALLNLVPEIYSEATGWTALPPTTDWTKPATINGRVPMYARLFLLGDGQIFYSGGQYGANEGLNPCLLNLTARSITEVPGLHGHAEQDHRNQSASVLLPPVQDQRVMLIGGGAAGGAGGHHGTEAINNVNIVNLASANPTYVAAPPLNLARMHLNAVLLPDRTVLVCGGSREEESRVQATLEAEIYDPATNNWKLAAKARVPRLYHSVALLLPDGRVITAGSNPARGDEELRLEMYYPPYLFKGSRPVINQVPQMLTYGATIELQTPQAATIQWVSLIKPMATTHALDSEQRVVDLPISSSGTDVLKATLTNEPNLAPPGWYMLFITDRRGVPSVAKWVHLERANG